MKRNINSLTGNSIEASDGLIGEVEEFYFDDVSWKIRCLIVKTGDWFGGKKVVIPVAHVGKIEWSDNLVFLAISKDAIDQSQPFEDKYAHEK